MSIQQDILDTIGADGVGVKALRERLGNIGANELDVAINALQRARRVRVVNERYEVLPSTRALGVMPHTGAPSADEEAAASLRPAPVKFHSARRQTINGGSGEAKLPGPVTEPEVNRLPDGAKPSSTTSAINGSSGGDRDRQPKPIATSESRDEQGLSAAASTQPVIADRVFERVKAQRQAALNKVALLQVEMTNLQAYISERETFLALYERFARGAAS